MIKRGLKGTRFSQIELMFPSDLDGIADIFTCPFAAECVLIVVFIASAIFEM
jgi:hypothetical protein